MDAIRRCFVVVVEAAEEAPWTLAHSFDGQHLHCGVHYGTRNVERSIGRRLYRSFHCSLTDDGKQAAEAGSAMRRARRTWHAEM